MDKRKIALLSALGATTIYGLNHTIAKEVMPHFIQGFGFVQLRLLGATVLFWAVSFFIPKQKVSLKDFPRMLLCSFFGMALNMLCFFKGIELSTPINSSVLITVTPILVFVFSRILIKEKFVAKRIWGVILGFIGAVVLIVFGNEVRQDAPNIPLGNFLFIINASAFAIYLIIVKPLSKKYTTIHLLKWLFLFGFIMALPITYKEFDNVVWENLPLNALWRFAYVVIGTTFLTYFLNVFALKYLKATSVSVFTYLQPLIGICYAIIVGADSLSLVKISAALGIMLGVYLVTKNYEKN